MTAVRIALAAIAAAALGSQQSATFTSGGTRILLSNVDQGNFEGLGQGNKENHFLANGKPAKLQSPEKGLTAIGKTLEFTWAELAPKTMEFRMARVEGNASISIDGEMSQRALIEEAEKAKKPAPKPLPETSVTGATSELFLYTGDASKGSISMPNPGTFQRTTKGTFEKDADQKDASKKDVAKKKVLYTFDQEFKGTGSKGLMNLVKGKDGTINQIEKGWLDGPVHFTIVRHETPEGGKTTTTTYDGVADRLEFDLTSKPGMITAIGHVVVDGTMPEDRSCHFEEDKFVVLVNEKLEPQGLKFWGKPGVTTGKTKEGKS